MRGLPRAGGEDLEGHNQYAGRCLHSRQEIQAIGDVEWRWAVRKPCPHCGKQRWYGNGAVNLKVTVVDLSRVHYS